MTAANSAILLVESMVSKRVGHWVESMEHWMVVSKVVSTVDSLGCRMAEKMETLLAARMVYCSVVLTVDKWVV